MKRSVAAGDGERHRTGQVRPRRLPPLLAAGCILVTALATALMVVNGQGIVGSFNLTLIVVGTVYAAVGGLVTSRMPDNRIGWLFLAAAWIWALDFFLSQYASYGLQAGTGSVPAATLAAWVSNWLWVPGNTLLLFGVPLLFPDGRLPSPRWRPITIFVIAAVVADTIGRASAAWAFRDDLETLLGNFDFSNTPGTIGFLLSVGDLFVFVVAPCVGLAALIIRYRSSHGVTRLQLRWFVAAVAVAVVAIIGDVIAAQLLPAVVGLSSAFGLILIPIGLSIAILRYRLYDLDRLVSRTIAYAVVTGLLVATFAASILLLQGVLAPFTQGQTVPVAGSTLAVAALFQPVMRRVRRAVDRRFDRARYDAERTAAAFSERLRDEVDLTMVLGDLTETTRGALAPAELGIWIRREGAQE